MGCGQGVLDIVLGAGTANVRDRVPLEWVLLTQPAPLDRIIWITISSVVAGLNPQEILSLCVTRLILILSRTEIFGSLGVPMLRGIPVGKQGEPCLGRKKALNSF